MIKEIEEYLAILKDLRGQVKKHLEGLSPEALDWRPGAGEGEPSTNSLTAIAVHLAGSETFWTREIIGGKTIGRDREAEFAARGIRAEDLQGKLDDAGEISEEVLSPLSPSRLEETRKFRDRTVSVRWAILHVLEHTATHLGHMQLTRQLWLEKNP